MDIFIIIFFSYLSGSIPFGLILTKTFGKIDVRNIGSGVPIKIRDFAEKIWSEKKAKGNLLFGTIPYRDGEVMRYVPDINSCYIIR